MGTNLNHHNLIILLLSLLLLHLSSTTNSQQQFQTKTYSFSEFGTDNRDNFSFSSFSSLSSPSPGALQITPDTINKAYSLTNKSGRVLLDNPFNLYTIPTSSNSLKSTRVASFNTSFTINIYRQPNTIPGEGFAFLIAPDTDDPPPNSHGQYLGLTNSTLDGQSSNHIIAIEFDTVKESYDPDANHVGLDINSIKSNITTSLTPFGIEISPVNATNYTVWIEYNGIFRHISVYMALQNLPKPTTAVINSSLDLSSHLLPKSYFGFAASTGIKFQLNCVLAWNLTVEILPDDESNSKNNMEAWKWILIIGLPLVALVVAIFFMRKYIKRKQVNEDPGALAGTLKSLPGTPREFEFKVLKKATNNFDEKMKLGQGGFGVVYRGVIPGENTEVAVKKFSRDNLKGQDDFLAELTIINRLRHKHLVRLLGWCHKNGMLLLVYEYMPNGSLDHHLFDTDTLLTWHHRYNIITGVASALHYLHNEYDQKVIHRDLKASNILLDSLFNARLGDFGLARAIDTDKTSYIDNNHGGILGTMGYIAPECFHTGKATRQSDIFSFGAIILEVVCGRRPRCDIEKFKFLGDWVWNLHRDGQILEAVDVRLKGDYVEEDAMRLLLLGLACCHPLPKERPRTSVIVQIISRSVAPPVVPPFKPAFVWPSGPVDEDEDNSGGLSSTVVSSSYSVSSSIAWTPQCNSNRNVDCDGFACIVRE